MLHESRMRAAPDGPVTLPEAVAAVLCRHAGAERGQALQRKRLERGSQVMNARYRNRTRPGAVEDVSGEERCAYLMHRFPATYAAVSRGLAFLPESVAETIDTVTDIGSGSGAATAAVLARLPGLGGARLVDADRRALALAGEITAAAGRESGSRARVKTVTADLGAGDIPAADLLVASYVLNEIGDAQIDRIVDALCHNVHRAVLIVEPGSRVGFAAIHRARARLVDVGARLLAPCPHNGACPMGQADTNGESKADWCHFAVSYRLPVAGTPAAQTEKFSFLLALAPATGAGGTLSASQPADNPAGRIVKAPIRRSGHVALDLCTDDGRLVRRILSRKDAGAYKRARDAHWGGRWDD